MNTTVDSDKTFGDIEKANAEHAKGAVDSVLLNPEVIAARMRAANELGDEAVKSMRSGKPLHWADEALSLGDLTKDNTPVLVSEVSVGASIGTATALESRDRAAELNKMMRVQEYRDPSWR